MAAQVRSPAQLSGLRIRRCHLCGIGPGCSSDLILGLGTSKCSKCVRKRKNNDDNNIKPPSLPPFSPCMYFIPHLGSQRLCCALAPLEALMSKESILKKVNQPPGKLDFSMVWRCPWPWGFWVAWSCLCGGSSFLHIRSDLLHCQLLAYFPFGSCPDFGTFFGGSEALKGKDQCLLCSEPQSHTSSW